MATTMNTWDLIKRRLELKLSSDTFQNWVSKTEFSHIQDNKLCVAVPNEETRDWMDGEYSAFGKVTQGLDVLRAIRNRPVNQDGFKDRPVEPVVIRAVTIETLEAGGDWKRLTTSN